MQVRTYGLYDGVSKEVVRTFTSNNDESAKRTTEIMLKDPKTDRSQAKDFILMYLYSFDTGTGAIVDDARHEICALASIMPEEVQYDQAGIDELKDIIKGQNAQINQLETKCQNLSNALDALSIPIRGLDPELSRLHPVIDAKKGKVIWLVKK